VPKIVDHDERRAVYVDALWRLVTREGAGAISVRNVAAEAGVSPSNVVHYLPTRADLLGAAVQQMLAEAISAAGRVDTMRLDLDRAVDMVMVTIPHTPARRRQSEVWLLLLAEQDVNADARHILSELQTAVRNGVRGGMDLLAAHALVHPDRDRDAEAERLHGLIDGLSVQTLINPRTLPAKRIRRIVTDHLAELSTPPPPQR